MNKEGFRTFTISQHTKLWQSKKAKSDNSYGIELDDGSWYWYTNWVDIVRLHCQQHNL